MSTNMLFTEPTCPYFVLCDKGFEPYIEWVEFDHTGHHFRIKPSVSLYIRKQIEKLLKKIEQEEAEAVRNGLIL